MSDTVVSFKHGVRWFGAKDVAFNAIFVAREVWGLFGIPELVVTSLLDGVHMEGSKHHTGEAVDLRTHNVLKYVSLESLASRLRLYLPRGYDVIIEHIGTPDEHIHIEWDPKLSPAIARNSSPKEA
jgi:hypothetical protein